MIARLWHKLFHPTPPAFDPDADDNVTYFREQRQSSEQQIERRSNARDMTRLYGEMRPFWERERRTGHDHP